MMVKHTQRQPVHILTVGAFGQAVAAVLKDLVPDVVATSTNEQNLTTPSYWPVARINILATWRPVPQIYQLFDGICYAWKKPWIPAVQEDHLIRIGPVVVPGAGACYGCYEKRFMQHSPRQAVYQALYKHYDAQPASGPQGYLPAFAEITAIRLAQIITHLDHDLTSEAGRFWQMDTISRHTVTAEVVGVNSCPRCGLQRDMATRSYKDLRQELSHILPWGIQEALYGPELVAADAPQVHSLEQEVVSANGTGGKK